jgi:hypothetical protein
MWRKFAVSRVRGTCKYISSINIHTLEKNSEIHDHTMEFAIASLNPWYIHPYYRPYYYRPYYFHRMEIAKYVYSVYSVYTF